VSLSTLSVTWALSHRKPASAYNFFCPLFPLHFNIAYFIEESRSALNFLRIQFVWALNSLDSCCAHWLDKMDTCIWWSAYCMRAELTLDPDARSEDREISKREKCKCCTICHHLVKSLRQGRYTGLLSELAAL